MNRFELLIEDVKAENLDDWWLKCYQNLDEIDDDNLFYSQFFIYEQALQHMDSNTYSAFKDKIIGLFKQNEKNRGKRAFFDQLNEAFAYEFLNKLGYTSIKFIPEVRSKNSIKTADLSFEKSGNPGLCEVKTISVSDNELSRYTAEEIFSSSAYKELDKGFFNKLRSDIDNANAKMEPLKTNKIIYIIVHFDDSILLYFPTYKKQITEYIKEVYPSIEIYFRVGLYGKKSIHCVPNSA